MAFTKIDRTGKGVTGLPDTPTLSTNDMQEKFDELGVLAVDGVNNLIDELEADGAASMGVYAPPGYTDTELQPLLDNIATDVTANKAAKHTHPNKSLLDTLTQSIFDTLNRIATIFINITSVSPTVSDSNQVLPTGHAIVNYVSRMGGGDMLRSTYDQNEDGTIDVTAGGTGANDAAGARTNLGLGSAATKASETTLSSSTSKVPTSSAVKTVTDGLGTRVTAAETSVSNLSTNVTQNYMAKAVYDTNGNGVVDTSENVRLNGRTDSIRFGIDSATGEYGYYKVGADSVTPFKTGGIDLLGVTPVRSFPNGTVVTLATNVDLSKYTMLGTYENGTTPSHPYNCMEYSVGSDKKYTPHWHTDGNQDPRSVQNPVFSILFPVDNRTDTVNITVKNIDGNTPAFTGTITLYGFKGDINNV